jgi:hypothetical protein
MIHPISQQLAIPQNSINHLKSPKNLIPVKVHNNLHFPKSCPGVLTVS